MMTSTDDVFVSMSAIYGDSLSDIIKQLNDNNNNDHNHNINNTINKYIDLGTGIGSILLIVANKLRPNVSIGLEAQKISVSILQKTLSELPSDAPNISTHLIDIRYVLNDFPELYQSIDLLTGNPPYLPTTTGRFPKDQQRQEARFETRGGIEDYCLVASQLLSHNGKFVCSFPTKDFNRVELAAKQSDLIITRRYDLLMGIPSRDISIFNMIKKSNNVSTLNEMIIEQINIQRDKETKSLSKLYVACRKLLQLNKRPLKE